MSRDQASAAWKRVPLVCADAAAVALEGARRFVKAAQESVAAHGEFWVALSGGRTPAALYRLLAAEKLRSQVNWGRIRLFWSDERAVPPEHPESNYGLAVRELLGRVAVLPARVHRMQVEREDLDSAAVEYEGLIRRHLRAAPDATPRFDLILLGLGADGHTASLFPGAEETQEANRLVRATRAEHGGLRRMTFTLPLLNAAKRVLFLVTGADKATALRDVIQGNPTLPAARVQVVDGEIVFLTDREAASLLNPGRGASRPDRT